MRICSVAELKDLRNNSLSFSDYRFNKDSTQVTILVCGGTGCKSSKSFELIEKFKEEIKSNGLESKVRVVMAGCFGYCAKGPVVNIFPDDTFYVRVHENDCKEIVEEHIIKGKIIERLLNRHPLTGEIFKTKKEMPFYKEQKRIALRNCGFINPENIQESIALGGYEALGKVLTTMSGESVIKEIIDSGLRGRGGGGFPTGVKWKIASEYESDKKYIICNADEGDPGAFMDRSILEGDPNTILEAMVIAGYAIGANYGYIYIRAEYPLAIHRLKIAIKQAKEYGLLGDNILNSGFSFNIEIKYGAGAFVCGEETSLINSIKGERGEPNIKPPFPAEKGLWNKPTCVNNVETFANISPIILKGASWYNKIGSDTSKGTKVFALAGNINNVGLVEVPMGTTLEDIIYKIGGGLSKGREIKAVQTGGPSGGCIPKELLYTQIDYEHLKDIGAMMGSGGMIVMDDKTCMVDIAKFYMEFIVDESCGKCTPCRVGSKRLLELLLKITKGQATLEDLKKLEELSEVIKDTALCGLGQTAPNPILSTIKYFKSEYESHIIDKSCPATKCISLKKYFITEKCIGCTKCARQCPVNCIEGVSKNRHVIDQSKCIKCGTCESGCPVKAIECN